MRGAYGTSESAKAAATPAAPKAKPRARARHASHAAARGSAHSGRIAGTMGRRYREKGKKTTVETIQPEANSADAAKRESARREIHSPATASTDSVENSTNGRR